MATEAPSLAPTEFVNVTEGFMEAELAEEEHEFDAISSLVLNITIIFCLLLAYFVKRYRIYSLPESAGALLVGIIIGGIARLSTDNLQLFEFVSPIVDQCSLLFLYISFMLCVSFSIHSSLPKCSSSSCYLRLSLRQGILWIARDSLKILVPLLYMPCLGQ